jgi:hypothetical protein
MELHLTISLPNEAGRYMVNPIHSHMRCMFGQISELLWVLDCYSIKTRFIRPICSLFFVHAVLSAWFSKCATQMNNICITWNPFPHLGLQNLNLPMNKIPKSFTCTIKFEKNFYSLPYKPADSGKMCTTQSHPCKAGLSTCWTDTSSLLAFWAKVTWVNGHIKALCSRTKACVTLFPSLPSFLALNCPR